MSLPVSCEEDDPAPQNQLLALPALGDCSGREAKSSKPEAELGERSERASGDINVET